MTNKVAQQIYQYLAKTLTLPQFSFQLGLTTNSSLIFTVLDETPRDYFCDANYFTYQVRLYAPKMEHSKQWTLINQIKDKLLNDDFKQLTYSNGSITYATSCVFINDLANPDSYRIFPDLESYTDATQCYTLKLAVILKERK